MTLARLLLDILYPRHCLVCTAAASHSLCDECSHQLVLFDNTDRCPTCFRERTGLCRHCHKEPMPFDCLAAALPLTPTAPLLSALRRRQIHLARPLASFLVAQLIELDWPIPDVIIPVPRRLPYGLHHTHLLAKETALLLNRPLTTPLRRRIGDYPQSALTPKERRALSRDRFRLRPHSLHDKTILLIDDTMSTRTTMRRCGEHLRDAFPKRLYGMCVAMPDTAD